MSQPEDFTRNEGFRTESYQTEPARGDLSGTAEGHRSQNGREPISRPPGSPIPAGTPLATPAGPGTPIGTPLPAGGGRSGYEAESTRQPLPVGRSLSIPGPGSGPAGEESSAMQRAMGVMKQAMPFVQRLLPLIDGNFATAIANLLTPRPHPPAPPPPPVDLVPVQNQLAELQLQGTDLKNQLEEQNSNLKRVEDQLEMVREATDRNTLEQQELIEDLKAVGNKVNLLAWVLVLLLLVSLGLNLLLFLHIQKVLP